MALIDRKRRQHGEDPVQKRLPQLDALRLVEVAVAQDADALALERRQKFALEQAHEAFERRAQTMRDRLELFLGQTAVVGAPLHLRCDLLLDRGHADHEIFVEVGAEDRHEFEAFEQRVALVDRLFEHAFVEFQPRKFAAVIQRRVVERNGCLGRALEWGGAFGRYQHLPHLRHGGPKAQVRAG